MIVTRIHDEIAFEFQHIIIVIEIYTVFVFAGVADKMDLPVFFRVFIYPCPAMIQKLAAQIIKEASPVEVAFQNIHHSVFQLRPVILAGNQALVDQPDGQGRVSIEYVALHAGVDGVSRGSVQEIVGNMAHEARGCADKRRICGGFRRQLGKPAEVHVQAGIDHGGQGIFHEARSYPYGLRRKTVDR
ncbi:hypothetical protein [Solidesulfovibrio fructosivorans]|uniref:hypothetical protein n=1 Tax=Solidesulfovibrio fructosivorans TaxID=878 RepID=UPI001F298507|nr:hypothetical protein [Solidesulfovibrio fructosivorans]